MVNLDGERWENESRNQERAARRARIERTNGGYDWVTRIDQITAKSAGKGEYEHVGEDVHRQEPADEGG